MLQGHLPHLSPVWFFLRVEGDPQLLSLKAGRITQVWAGEPGEGELHCAMAVRGAMATTRQHVPGPEDGRSAQAQEKGLGWAQAGMLGHLKAGQAARAQLALQAH